MSYVVYTGDLVVAEESEPEAREAFKRCREGMKTRELKVNLEKANVMITA